MSSLDSRMAEAVTGLRDDLDRSDPPPFRPKRSATPVMVIIVLVLGIGIAGYVARATTDESGGVVVATQPDDDRPPVTGDTVAQHQITRAGAGEFWMPLPMGVAWSNDESRLLMYRTGAAAPGHFVVDARTGGVIAELPFAPADIEQVYWHPLNDDLLLYTDGADLIVYSLATGTSDIVHSFVGCDHVDAGVLPVAPTADGTMSLLCHRTAETEQVTFDLPTGNEVRAATASDTAALPSPSGHNLVRANDDGSATVLDEDLQATGVQLAVEGNLFGFVTEDDGREWIATTLFDGPVVGSVVLLPLDGADPPVVVVGPDQGDEYPPRGTQISASGRHVAIAIAGIDDGALAGRVLRVALGDSFQDQADVERLSISHGSAELHDYWSKPFISLSPSGQFVVYSSDGGTDRVNTFVADFGRPSG